MHLHAPRICPVRFRGRKRNENARLAPVVELHLRDNDGDVVVWVFVVDSNVSERAHFAGQKPLRLVGEIFASWVRPDTDAHGDHGGGMHGLAGRGTLGAGAAREREKHEHEFHFQNRSARGGRGFSRSLGFGRFQPNFFSRNWRNHPFWQMSGYSGHGIEQRQERAHVDARIVFSLAHGIDVRPADVG